MLSKSQNAGHLERVTLNLGEPARRFLVERAAEQSIAAGRPVSVSAVAREVLARAAAEQGDHGGEAA